MRALGSCLCISCFLTFGLAPCHPSERAVSLVEPRNEIVSSRKAKEVIITIVYDNNPFAPNLTTAWGFACLVEGMEKTILFDTGGSGETLLANMRQLGIDPKEIEVIVLSHVHGDHTGGLEALLARNNQVSVYMPVSFPESLKSQAQRAGARVIEVSEPHRICEGAQTTGELGTAIKEQSLILHTREGLVVITGCAHPGIAHIVEHASQLTGTRVELVLGGFHMGGASDATIRSAIATFKRLGVRRVAPCHCSGSHARESFQKAFPEGYVPAGAGTKLRLAAEPGER